MEFLEKQLGHEIQFVSTGAERDHRLHTVKVGQGVEAGDFHAVQLVTGDDRDLLHAAQHVQLGRCV